MWKFPKETAIPCSARRTRKSRGKAGRCRNLKITAAAIPLAAPTAAPYHRFASSRPGCRQRASPISTASIPRSAAIADLAGGQGNGFVKEGLGRINSSVERAMAGFSVSDPEKIAPLLAEGLKETNDLIAQVATSSLSDQAKYDVTFELRAKQRPVPTSHRSGTESLFRSDGGSQPAARIAEILFSRCRRRP